MWYVVDVATAIVAHAGHHAASGRIDCVHELAVHGGGVQLVELITAQHAGDRTGLVRAELIVRMRIDEVVIIAMKTIARRHRVRDGAIDCVVDGVVD